MVYLNVVFSEVNKKFVKFSISHKLERVGFLSKALHVIGCIIAQFLSTQLNPILKSLQFLMGFVLFSVFLTGHTSTRYFAFSFLLVFLINMAYLLYMTYFSHSSCDNIPEIPNMDTTLAVFSTLLAWYLFLPFIFTLSKVRIT